MSWLQRIEHRFRKNTLVRLRAELQSKRHEYELEREAAFVEAQRHQAAADFHRRRSLFLSSVVEGIDDQLGELSTAIPSQPPGTP